MEEIKTVSLDNIKKQLATRKKDIKKDLQDFKPLNQDTQQIKNEVVENQPDIIKDDNKHVPILKIDEEKIKMKKEIEQEIRYEIKKEMKKEKKKKKKIEMMENMYKHINEINAKIENMNLSKKEVKENSPKNIREHLLKNLKI